MIHDSNLFYVFITVSLSNAGHSARKSKPNAMDRSPIRSASASAFSITDAFLRDTQVEETVFDVDAEGMNDFSVEIDSSTVQ